MSACWLIGRDTVVVAATGVTRAAVGAQLSAATERTEAQADTDHVAQAVSVRLRLLDDPEEPQRDDDKYDQDNEAECTAHVNFLYVTLT